MRELESSLQQLGEYLLRAQVVREKVAPFFVRWVRLFLFHPATDEPLGDRVRGFCEELERGGRHEDWQVRQAEQALRVYFVDFLARSDWQRRAAGGVVDKEGRVDPLAALERMRDRRATPPWPPPQVVAQVDPRSARVGHQQQRLGWPDE